VRTANGSVLFLVLAAACVKGEKGPGEHDARAFATAPAALPPDLGPGEQTGAWDARSEPAWLAREAGLPAPPVSIARPLSRSLQEIARDPHAPGLDTSGALRVAVLSVSGGLVADAERRVLRMKSGFRACLAHGDEAEPDRGQLTLDVVVAESGAVRSAGATNVEAIGASVVECIERRALAATFQPPVGGRAHVTISVVWGQVRDGG
jgi:hypothetical protein